MYYKESGCGEEVVLFLHGWGASSETMQPLISQFEKKYKVLCVDFWGHGKSETPSRVLTVFDFAFSVSNLLQSLCIKKVNIVAHSFGARVAFILASNGEIEVEKMVLFGPAGVKPKFSFKKFAKIKAFKFLKFLNKLKLYSSQKLEKWGSEDYKKLSQVMKKTFVNVVSCDLKIFLNLIKAKTLIIIGENDKETPIYMGKIINKKIKNSSFIIEKNCGHFCFLEKRSTIKVAYNFIKC